MKTNSWFAPFFCVLILLTANNAFAEEKAAEKGAAKKDDKKSVNMGNPFANMMKPSETGGWFPPMLEKDLALTDEQKKKLKALKEEVGESWKKEQQDIQAAKLKMDEQMGTMGSDSDVRAAFKAMQKKRESLEEKKFSQLLKVRSVLNADQRKKVSEFQAKANRGGQMPFGGKGLPPGLMNMKPGGPKPGDNSSHK